MSSGPPLPTTPMIQRPFLNTGLIGASMVGPPGWAKPPLTGAPLDEPHTERGSPMWLADLPWMLTSRSSGLIPAACAGEPSVTAWIVTGPWLAASPATKKIAIGRDRLAKAAAAMTVVG